MPKKGPSPLEWRQRLQKYAQGEFQFQRGQRPPKGSVWAFSLEKIEKCPRQNNASLMDPLGRCIECNCGYHRPVATTLAQGSSSSAPPPKFRPNLAAARPVTTLAQGSSSSAPPPKFRPNLAAARCVEPIPSDEVECPTSAPPPSSEQAQAPLPTMISQPLPDELHPLPPVSLSETALQSSPSLTPPPKRPCIDPQPVEHVITEVSMLKRRAMDYSSRLPQGWEQGMSPTDRVWIGKELFVAKGKLSPALKLWYYPPPVEHHNTQPQPEAYYRRRLLLWMPRRMWQVEFKCPFCAHPLHSKGVYHRIRKVLDIKDYYYLAAEYMKCQRCHGMYIAWDGRMLDQLAAGVRAQFPATLTYRYACDNSIMSLLRARTLGNSPTALCNNLMEVHSEEWLRRQLGYLSDCVRHKIGLVRMGITPPEYAVVEPFPKFPTAWWFLSVYVRDVWSRLSSLLAALTSTYGRILKIDSTKKVCRKLQGKAANTASWATSIGNERGEIVITVLTSSEGAPALKPLADDLVRRYREAGQDPPILLYTDRDCCCITGPSKFQELFAAWTGLTVRLDAWHFMRRLAAGVSSESHPLYGLFMGRLSLAIYEWDEGDYQRLMEAKQGEMRSAGLSHPSDTAVRKAISRDELLRHCRRRTRGVQQTTSAVEALLLSFSCATDTLGVPLLKEEMRVIWQEQKQHVACLQDPHGLELYTMVGHIEKGGIRLPVFRCARGTTSLESFHLHLARFIPGTSASAINFQAFLVDGLVRWNRARAMAAHEGQGSNVRTFDLQLQHQVNALSQQLHGTPVLTPAIPAVYTGELIGVEYLLAQQGEQLCSGTKELEKEIDEGFGEVDLTIESDQDFVSVQEEAIETAFLPTNSDNDSDSKEEEEMQAESEEAVDSAGVAGWDKVDALADALLSLQGLSVTNKQAENIRSLYTQLLEFDKRPIVFRPQQVRPSRGRFARKKRTGFRGVEAMKRCFLSAGSPASSPKKSRLVQAILVKLCDRITQPRRERRADGKQTYISRWKLVLSGYNNIRTRLMNSQALLEGTNLMLYTINETTLVQWYKNKERIHEIRTLLQGLELPPLATCSREPLPDPLQRSIPPPPPDKPHVFSQPEDTTGRAQVRGAIRGVSVSVFVPPQSSSSVSPLPALPSTSPSPGPSASSLVPPELAAVETKPVSRTTQWRHKSRQPAKERKVYTCQVCSKPMTSPGHTQYRGRRYCPEAPGQVPVAEWLQQRRAEAAATAQAKKGAEGSAS